MSKTSIRSALSQIYQQRSNSSPSLVPLTTPKILRKTLKDSFDIEWNEQEWKRDGGKREQVLKVWNEIQEENSLGAVEASNEPQSKSASSNSKSKGGKGKVKQVKQVVQEVMVLSSSQPHLSEESEQEDEEELVIPKKKRKTTSENEKGKKREKKSKYDRLAEKNLGNFMGMALGGMMTDLLGGAEDHVEEEEEGEGFDQDDIEQAQSETSEMILSDTPPPPVASTSKKQHNGSKKKSTTATTKQPRISKGKGKKKEPNTIFKSTEFVQDSDDSSNELPVKPTTTTKDTKGRGKGKGKAVVVDSEDEEEEESSSSSSSVQPLKKKKKSTESTVKKEKKKKSKEPVKKKEGDAEKGTDEQEERIKKLKNLLKLAGTPRAFTPKTGPERTLSITRRFEILSSLLNDLGLKVTRDGSSGKLPSETRAKEIGKRREIEKDSEALQGTSMKHLGLRTGKKRQNRPNDSEDDEQSSSSSTKDDSDDVDKGTMKGKKKRKSTGGPREITPKRKKLEERKKFASFLGDQGDSD
ncbi:hypothetical protein JCM5350_005922 [Sporobolomyces pararoseus]